jgi:hypothetical protein
MQNQLLNEEKMKSGQASLDAMLLSLQPYLPKPDLEAPQPTSQWRLAEDRISNSATADRTGIAAMQL